jgi:general secretion pathway protein K
MKLNMNMEGRQRGVALITAVLVVALASIASAAMLVSSNLAIHRTTTLIDTERAWWYASGVEAWVAAGLQLDAQNSKTDNLGEIWARPVDYIPVDEGGLRGNVTDLQGRFNLNNLAKQPSQPGQKDKYLEQFNRLLQNIPAAQQLPIEGLGEAIRDWIDEDSNPAGFGGAEDGEYSSLTPPYRAANRLMVSPSELLAVRGVTRDLYLALRDYVSALPTMTPVNVNTAAEPVLRSLSEQPSQGLAQFLESRKDHPADDVQQLFDQGVFGTDVDKSSIAVSTEYFLLRSESLIGSSRVALYSVIHRPAKGDAVILGRSQDIE